MTLLKDPYYEAVVISDEIDTNHAGAVRVSILGVTDKLENDFQPFVLPAINGMQAVPTKGTLLYVTFDEGDINMGRYFFVAQDKDFLPPEYVAEYPNVAVTNLGDDLFILTHNRKTNISVITHPSSSSITWDAFGAVTHDSDNGYTNAGQGALNNQGTKSLSVLTEGTVDPFTCTVFGNNLGNGGAHQGSEYLFVTHISKGTVDAINGKVVADNENDTMPATEIGGSELVTNPIYGADGSEVGSVEYYPSEAFVERKDKVISHILVANSGNNNFVETAAKIGEFTSTYSAHYLIGRSNNTPPMDSARAEDTSAVASGFLQFIELTNDVYFANNAKILPSTDSANKNAVVIMLVGDGTSYTDYQYDTLNKLITHVKYIAKDTGIPMYVTDNLIAVPAYDKIGALDPSRINK